MNTFLIITIVSNTLARYIPNSGSPNVGTVLFETSDTHKAHWSKANIALLQARKYFQDSIPSPQIAGSINEEYIINLLNYFENCYKTVKRKTRSLALRNIMDVALSDALGGYLKIWVLPITKYAYYGGTVSLDSSLKIFDTYEDIKRSLKTDGNGWCNPNKEILNSVAINIISLPSTVSRSIGKPCEQLTYYEKNDSGLQIPLPYINWNLSPPSMFLPLANESIVSLSSPSSSSSLLKYYAVADKCMKSQIPKLNDFYIRFQNWLSKEVTPHLHDDKLYAAFGSVLGLMNTTTECCCDKIENIKDYLMHDANLISLENFFIIAVIIIIEIVGCTATIVYMVWFRKKKRRGRKRTKKNYNLKHKFYLDRLTHTQPNSGFQLFFQPKTKNKEVNVQFPTSAESSIILSASDFSHCDFMTLADDVPLNTSSITNVPELSTSKTLIKNSNTKRNTESHNSNSAVGINTRDLKITNTMSLIQNREKIINEITYLQEENIELINKPSSNVKCNISQNNEKITKDIYSHNVHRIKESPNKLKSEVIQDEYKSKSSNLINKELEKKVSDKVALFTHIEPIFEKQNRAMVETNYTMSNIKKVCKLNQPVLRILIERPQTSIKVGITTVKGLGTMRKPSKIPRVVKSSGKETDESIRKTPDTLTNSSQVSMESTHETGLVILGKALDDSGIK